MAIVELSSQVEIVQKYYADIDAQDVPAALRHFASTAVYRRPGYAEMDGLAAIEEFYSGTRALIGSHVIDSVVGSGPEIAVRGHFDGSLRDEPLQFRFADFWLFAGAEVIERNSYLFQPATHLM